MRCCVLGPPASEQKSTSQMHQHQLLTLPELLLVACSRSSGLIRLNGRTRAGKISKTPNQTKTCMVLYFAIGIYLPAPSSAALGHAVTHNQSTNPSRTQDPEPGTRSDTVPFQSQGTRAGWCSGSWAGSRACACRGASTPTKGTPAARWVLKQIIPAAKEVFAKRWKQPLALMLSCGGIVLALRVRMDFSHKNKIKWGIESESFLQAELVLGSHKAMWGARQVNSRGSTRSVQSWFEAAARKLINRNNLCSSFHVCIVSGFFFPHRKNSSAGIIWCSLPVHTRSYGSFLVFMLPTIAPM